MTRKNASKTQDASKTDASASTDNASANVADVVIVTDASTPDESAPIVESAPDVKREYVDVASVAVLLMNNPDVLALAFAGKYVKLQDGTDVAIDASMDHNAILASASGDYKPAQARLIESKIDAFKREHATTLAKAASTWESYCQALDVLTQASKTLDLGGNVLRFTPNRAIAGKPAVAAQDATDDSPAIDAQDAIPTVNAWMDVTITSARDASKPAQAPASKPASASNTDASTPASASKRAAIWESGTYFHAGKNGTLYTLTYDASTSTSTLSGAGLHDGTYNVNPSTLARTITGGQVNARNYWTKRAE